MVPRHSSLHTTGHSEIVIDLLTAMLAHDAIDVNKATTDDAATPLFYIALLYKYFPLMVKMGWDQCGLGGVAVDVLPAHQCARGPSYSVYTPHLSPYHVEVASDMNSVIIPVFVKLE